MQTLPFHCNRETHEYNTRSRNHIHRGKASHTFAFKSLRHNLPLVVNDTIPEIIEKIDTHSLHGFAGYIKYQYTGIDKYNEECNIENCYICNRN